jgi:hypothetical protein
MDIKDQDPRFDETAWKVVKLDRKLRPAAKERARNLVPKGKSHAGTRAVFDAILDRINMTETGFWTLSYKQLEDATGYQRRQIMRAVKFLRLAGLLMVKVKFTAKGDRDRNDYTIPVLVGPPLPLVEKEGGGDMGVTRGGDMEGTTLW